MAHFDFAFEEGDSDKEEEIHDKDEFEREVEDMHLVSQLQWCSFVNHMIVVSYHTNIDFINIDSSFFESSIDDYKPIQFKDIHFQFK